MTKPNPENERQKRAYFAFLREAHGRDETTIDRVAASLARFEASTKARDFARFHREQAVAFKARLLETANARTGERLSKATVLSTLRDLRVFFLWLAREPGYRSKIAFSDADYFNLPDKDVAVARARRRRFLRQGGFATLFGFTAAARLEAKERHVQAQAKFKEALPRHVPFSSWYEDLERRGVQELRPLDRPFGLQNRLDRAMIEFIGLLRQCGRRRASRCASKANFDGAQRRAEGR
ncbi:hypothetical protein [Methylocella sp.]|uniref:hypothetical protein n=1 Tax=Methylocella sp. TaxID=1978226 RepID=UPI0035B37D2E